MTCSVEGCRRKVLAKTLCNMHYKRLRKYGSLDHPRPKRMCSVEGCDWPAKARGLCDYHYCRWYRAQRKGHIA